MCKVRLAPLSHGFCHMCSLPESLATSCLLPPAPTAFLLANCIFSLRPRSSLPITWHISQQDTVTHTSKHKKSQQSQWSLELLLSNLQGPDFSHRLQTCSSMLLHAEMQLVRHPFIFGDCSRNNRHCPTLIVAERGSLRSNAFSPK